MDPIRRRSTGELTLHSLRERALESYAAWVRLGILLCAGGYLVSIVLRLALGNVSWVVVAEAATVFAAGVALVLARRGLLVTAAGIVLGTVWLELNLAIFHAGDFRGSAAFVFPTLVLATGLLLGSRWAFAAAVASGVGAVGAAALGGWTGNGPGLRLFPDGHLIAVFGLGLLATAGLVQAGLRALFSVVLDSESSKNRYRDLVREAPDGILTTDGELRLREVNPAGEAILGGRAEDLRGHPLEELLPGAAGRELAAALGEAGDESIRRVLEVEGAPRRVLDVAARRFAHGPREAHVQVMLRDVTDRATLQEREAELGRLFSEAGTEILVFRVDDGVLLQVSQGALDNLGSTRGEILGRPVAQVCPNMALEGLQGLTERLSSVRRSPVRERGLHRRADGSVYPVETEYLRFSLGGECVVVAFAVDITERTRADEEQRQLQRQLEHAQRMEAVGHLAGGVAHDFNNLLTVIGGSAEVLQEEAPPELWDLIQEIVQAREQGAVLTRQLLTFARREVAQTRVLHLAGLFHQLHPLLVRLAGPRVEIALEPPAGGAILADPGQVEQVLMNLVANARDAMPSGGRIVLSAYPERSSAGPERWSISVTDTGTGMDEATQARIFEPFFTTKTRGKGTGLGLATVHGIVSQNGGEIRVDSTPGKGTRFDVLWPAADESEIDETEAEGDAPGETPPDRGLRVLLAEDDEGARRMVRRMLEMDGHQVDAVASGEEAEALLEAEGAAFDLLVTDVVMPGISGIELLGRVRAAGWSLPALLVSGYLDERLHGAVPGDPATALLHKPFRRAELQEHVARLVSASRMGSTGRRAG